VLTEPTPFENYDMSYLGENGKAAAESCKPDLKERKEKSAQGGGPRNLF
jgi:hypothetical protein